MANLDKYWGKIKETESFQGLDDGQKEKVRQKLFDTYIQSSDSYLNLPQSKRIAVKKHFDEVTHVQPEGLITGLERKGKKFFNDIEPTVKSGVDAGKKVVKTAEALYEGASAAAELIEPEPMKLGYQGLKKGAELVSKGGKKLGEMVEPSDADMQAHSAMETTLPKAMPKMLTDYDRARLYASASIQTVSNFIAGAIPTSYIDTASFAAIDGILKASGTTFLGKERHLPNWKPKTGLSESVPTVGGEMERMLIRANVEANIREMRKGPPAPLEQMANVEEQLKAQGQVDEYQKWLEERDKLSDSGGEPVGDLHPDLKANVSQLRDYAQARLQKLKEEPAHLENLSQKEDELHGFFRTAMGRVYMMPEASERLPRTEMLPEGPKPAGLLNAGPPERTPARTSARTPPPAAPAAPSPAKPVITAQSMGETGIRGYKTHINNAFAKLLPKETKQTVDKLSGALLNALKGEWIHPTNPKPLTPEMAGMLDRLVEDATRIHLDEKASEAPPKTTTRASEASRLSGKGLSLADVEAEAKRLQDEHNATTGISELEKFIKGEGGLKKAPGMEEEHTRNVPKNLYGNVMPDDMAQRAFEANLLPDAKASTLYEELSNRGETTRTRSQRSFMDDAERNLEHQLKVQAGFEQEQIADMPAASMPPGAIKQPSGQVPEEALLEGLQNPDNSQRSMYDIMSEVGNETVRKLKGEGGGFGSEPFDPVRQARLEENIRELVSRARALGYTTTQDILVYAAKNAPLEIQRAMQKSLAKTLSPFDSHAYKEVDAARAGDPVAKKGLMDRAMREYLSEAPSRLKGTWQRLKANSQVLRFKDADEALMNLKNNLLLHDSFRKHNRFELAAQRWYNEGKAPSFEALSNLVPESDAKEMLRLVRDPSENMKRAKALTQSHEDEMHHLFSEYYDELGYVENHVTRRWQRPKEYLNWEGKALQNRPNFSKGRKLLSQAEGIDAGMVPVSLDIREDLKASNSQRVSMLSRLHMLSKIASTFDKFGRGSIIDEEGKSILTPHKGEAPATWLRYPDSYLKGLAINPEYKTALDYIHSTRIKGWGADLMDWLSASSKATTLGISGFHPLSLTEMLLTGVSYRDVFTFNTGRNILWKTLRTIAKGATESLENPLEFGNPLTTTGRAKNAKSLSALYDSYMKGSAVLANRPLALDMAEQGFHFTALDDDAFNILNRHMKSYQGWLENRIKNSPDPKATAMYRSAAQDVEGVRKTYEVFDKTLWAYMKDSFSMSIYENQVADNIRKFNLEAPEGKKLPVEKIKQDTVDFVNKEMGGISMAKLLITPRTQQVLQWALLAPSWTIGRALMGSELVSAGPGGRQARKQALRMAVGYYLIGNLANYANTKAAFGKGRWMHDNPEDQKLNIFWKLNDKKEELYLQGSKASTEIVDDLVHPMRTLAYKTSKPVQAAVNTFNWATARGYYPGISPENPAQAAVNMFKPSVASGLSAYGSVPVKRGVTPAKIGGLLDQYYATGKQKFLDDALRFGAEAGIDIKFLDRSARSRHRSEVKKETRQEIQKKIDRERALFQ